MGLSNQHVKTYNFDSVVVGCRPSNPGELFKSAGELGQHGDVAYRGGSVC